MKNIMLTLVAASSLAVGGCARNFAGEGAAAGAVGGAVVGALTGEGVVDGAVVGAAASAAVGYFVDKDNACGGYDANGRLDDDCRGQPGYPPR